jgi:hypothetical protein
MRLKLWKRQDFTTPTAYSEETNYKYYRVLTHANCGFYPSFLRYQPFSLCRSHRPSADLFLDSPTYSIDCNSEELHAWPGSINPAVDIPMSQPSVRSVEEGISTPFTVK